MAGGYQPSVTTAPLVIAGNSPVLCRQLPEALARSEVPRFLEAYGYGASDAACWRPGALLPRLSLRVLYHTKADGHTFYHVECTLAQPDSFAPYLAWRSLRRLSQLRQGLHDPVKQGLGPSYKTEFAGVPFASRYSLADATQRLNCWCRRLAEVVSGGRAPPWVAATALQVLGGPDVTQAAARVAEERDAAATAQDNFKKVAIPSASSSQPPGDLGEKPGDEAGKGDDAAASLPASPSASPAASVHETHLGTLMSEGAIEFVIGRDVERIGIVLDRLPPAEHLVVREIRDDTPAALRGLTVGSKLLAVNGRSVADIQGEEFSTLMRSTRPLVLLFLHCAALSPSAMSASAAVDLQSLKLDTGEDAEDDDSGSSRFSENEPEEEVEICTAEAVHARPPGHHRGSF